ncbi:hypothetical protein NUM3379_28430 [Kineococcus sp. NUM-3379]
MPHLPLAVGQGLVQWAVEEGKLGLVVVEAAQLRLVAGTGAVCHEQGQLLVTVLAGEAGTVQGVKARVRQLGGTADVMEVGSGHERGAVIAQGAADRLRQGRHPLHVPPAPPQRTQRRPRDLLRPLNDAGHGCSDRTFE